MKKQYVKLFEEFVLKLNEDEVEQTQEQITQENYEDKLYTKTPEEFLGILYSLKINQMYSKMDLNVRKILTSAFIQAFGVNGNIDIQKALKVGIKISRTADSGESYVVVLDDSLLSQYKQWGVFEKSLFNIPIFHIPDFSKEDIYDKKPAGTLGAFLGFDKEMKRDQENLKNTFNYVTAKDEEQNGTKIKPLSYKDEVPNAIGSEAKESFVSNYLPKFKSIASKVKPKEKDLASNVDKGTTDKGGSNEEANEIKS